MSNENIQILEETPGYILLEIQERTESGAIEQAEEWAKLEGVEFSHIERLVGEGLQSANAGSPGVSRDHGLGLYYYLKLMVAEASYSPRTIQLDQVIQ